MTHATRRGNATFGVLLVLIGVAIAILNAVAFHPGAGTQWTKRTEHVHTLEDGSEVRWTEHEAVSVKEGQEMARLKEGHQVETPSGLIGVVSKVHQAQDSVELIVDDRSQAIRTLRRMKDGK